MSASPETMEETRAATASAAAGTQTCPPESPIIAAVQSQEWLDSVGSVLQSVADAAFGRSGPAQGSVNNALHGTWLGHPLHPVLTDIPIGSWTAGLALDIAGAASSHKALDAGADVAAAVGLAGAIGAALTGLDDWQHVDNPARRVGTTHAGLNITAALLYTGSLVARGRGARGTGRALSAVGYVVAAASAYLGGHLIYRDRIGVDHADRGVAPAEFVPVLGEDELPEGEMRKVVADGVSILLVRRNGEIRAIGETCSHLGGPLAEGTLDEHGVTCPWHGSRFSLDEKGRVLSGPATAPEPCFETRVRRHKIEVRRSRANVREE